MSRTPRTPLMILVLTALLAGPAAFAQTTAPAQVTAPQQAEWNVLSDTWYALSLAGAQVGWMRIVREDDGQRYRTANEMSLRFQQFGATAHIETLNLWLETHDGHPLRFQLAERNLEQLETAEAGARPPSIWEQIRQNPRAGSLKLKRAWEFDGENVTMIVPQADADVRVPALAPAGQWQPPAAMQRLMAQQIRQDSQAFEYDTINAATDLQTLHLKSERVGSAEFPLHGKPVPVTVWRTRSANHDSPTLSYYAEDGALMYSLANLAIGVLETRACSKDEALSIAAKPAPIVSLNITPDRPISATMSATYEIALPQGKLPGLPSAGAQTVVMNEDGSSARLTVDLAQHSPAGAVELAESQVREGAPTGLEHDAIELRLAAESMKQTQGLTPLDLAQASWKVVRDHYESQIDQADEANDHGIKRANTLAWVLRVHRIPARIVCGLAFVPTGDRGAFQTRVWTQGLIEEKWN